MKQTSTFATLAFVVAINGCSAKKNSAATKDIINTTGTTRISAPQEVDPTLEKSVLDATGRYLCFGLSSDMNFIVWTATSHNNCTFSDDNGYAGSQSRYVKGVTLKRFRQSERTDKPNVTFVRYMIGTIQVGGGEFDSSPLGGFSLKDLCSGEVANACDLVIQGDEIEINLKK